MNPSFGNAQLESMTSGDHFAPSSPVPETQTVQSMLKQLREKLDEQEAITAKDKAVKAEIAGLKLQLIHHAQSQGLDQFRGGGLTVSIDFEAVGVAYDPEKWNDVFKWAAETGNAHLIHRRLSASAVEELVKSGVALPEGLTLTTYPNLTYRRV